MIKSANTDNARYDNPESEWEMQAQRMINMQTDLCPLPRCDGTCRISLVHQPIDAIAVHAAIQHGVDDEN